MLNRIFAALASLVLPATPPAAQTEDAASWYLNRSPEGSKMTHGLGWDNPNTRIMVADPVVYPDSLNSKWIDVPAGPAQVFTIFDPKYRSPFATVLQFSDAPVVCAKSVGIFGVDAGTGAFLTPDATDSIAAYLPTLKQGWTLYDGLWAEQSQDHRLSLFILQMPDGTSFPTFSTGGDGGFEVFAFQDANGKTTALSTAFWDTDPTTLHPLLACTA